MSYATLNADPLGEIKESRSRNASRGRGADALKTPRQDVYSTQQRGPARGGALDALMMLELVCTALGVCQRNGKNR
ncbi:MAG: hypothetical protein ACPL3C_08175 [Pyrobaculum sp.]